jgi:hypothetical protein
MIAVSLEFSAPTASRIDQLEAANCDMPSFIEPGPYAGRKTCAFNIRAKLRNLGGR